jgi:predicted short-subunit dehydrogenase-like oxidoreductase (DUF2520 family)
MRQVPEYLLIGRGRVALHVAHYFSLLNIPFQTWSRAESIDALHARLATSTHVLLLISDDAIEAFAKTHLQTFPGFKIHFSGSLVSDQVIGAHPLQSFSNELYSLDKYLSVPFVIDHDAPDFKELFPDFSNSHSRLNKASKAKYHALCVLSGNFSCMLWQKLFNDLETDCLLPKNIAHAYLQQQTQNLLDHPERALTGPLVRGDVATIEKNLAALVDDEFQQVYASFVACYAKLKEKGVA